MNGIKRKQGFTLVELVTVLAILAVIVAIVVPFVNGYIYDSKLNEDKAVAINMQNAIDTWMHLDRTDETDRVSCSYLGVTDKIGKFSEYQYYTKYAGANQLPGTEFTKEEDIRKAVLSAMKAVMGNGLVIKPDWTIDSPKAGIALSYRYYYRLGLVKVVELAKKEDIDELSSYYITLDRVGYSNIAGNKFDKVEEKDEESIIDKKITLYGLDIGKLPIKEEEITVWNLDTNIKTTVKVSNLIKEKLFTTGLYYITGKAGETPSKTKFLLVISETVGKCYSLGSDIKADTKYIQEIKNEINSNSDNKIDKNEIKEFIEGKSAENAMKILGKLGAIESSVAFNVNKYVIDYTNEGNPPWDEEPDEDDPTVNYPDSLFWHIVGDVKYVEGAEVGSRYEDVPHITEKDEGLKVYFYGDVTTEGSWHRYNDIYDWETDVFEVKNTTICLELDSSDAIYHNGNIYRSDNSPNFEVSIIAIDEKGNESLYAKVLNRGEVYSGRSTYSNTKTTGVIKLEDGKYRLRTSEGSAKRAWLNVYFGEQTTEKLLPETISKGVMTLEDDLVSFDIYTPTVLSFKYVDWHFNYDYGISATIVINKDFSNYLIPRVNGKTLSTIVLTPGHYQIGLVKGKEASEAVYSQSTAKIFDIVETIPKKTMIIDNCLSDDDGYGGNYILS